MAPRYRGRLGGAGVILNRYLISEISKPLAVILGIFVALFASYSAAAFLSDAVNGLVPIDIVAEMIGLKALISLEVLIPISLYMSVVFAFGRLHGDSEFTAMFALHVTPARVVRAVLVLSGVLALVVAGLSLIARPWAYDKLHGLSKRAEVMLDVNAMKADTFYVGQHGNRVIFLSHRDGPEAPARDVFIKLQRSDHTEIIHARLAYPLLGNDTNVYLRDAHIYRFFPGVGQTDQVLTAAGILIDPNSPDDAPPEYSSVAASTTHLVQSSSARDVAELQWRLSTPLSTLLLGLLGIPLSRGRPRQNKYENFGTAILIYSTYYLLCTSARTWVQHGVVSGFPGIWWAPAMLALLLLIFAFGPDLGAKLRRRQA
jgi:lipopolysaccharide export system permease protein